MKKLYLLGHPVSHSLSPVMQNAAIRHFGLDWHYETKDVTPENLIPTLEELEADPDVIGCNVTVPHKVAVYEWLGEHRLKESAKQVHAVNTLFRRGDEKFQGDSTDFQGGMLALGRESILQRLSRSNELMPDFNDLDIAILGTGGSARSFGALLCTPPFDAKSVTLFGRSAQKAMALAISIKLWSSGSRVSVQSLPLSEFHTWNRERKSVVIQTTTVGMETGDNPGQSPVPSGSVGKGQIAFDLVYKPLNTPFLIDAAKNGATVVHGIGMLVGQGALSLQQWIESSAGGIALWRFDLIDTMDVMRSALGV